MNQLLFIHMFILFSNYFSKNFLWFPQDWNWTVAACDLAKQWCHPLQVNYISHLIICWHLKTVIKARGSVDDLCLGALCSDTQIVFLTIVLQEQHILDSKCKLINHLINHSLHIWIPRRHFCHYKLQTLPFHLEKHIWYLAWPVRPSVV